MAEFTQLYVYKVTDDETAEAGRSAALDALTGYDGFVSWTAYVAAQSEDGPVFIDWLIWASPEQAAAAGERFMEDAGTQAFRNAMAGQVFMSPAEMRAVRSV